jgi:hypothetical protein
MKINKDWKVVFKRYSFITNLLVALSSVGMIAIVPFIDYIPLWVGASVTGVLALFGVVGSFIKQEIQEDDAQERCNVDAD